MRLRCLSSFLVYLFIDWFIQGHTWYATGRLMILIYGPGWWFSSTLPSVTGEQVTELSRLSVKCNNHKINSSKAIYKKYIFLFLETPGAYIFPPTKFLCNSAIMTIPLPAVRGNVKRTLIFHRYRIDRFVKSIREVKRNIARHRECYPCVPG